jgi:glycosyltransferase involved in cell wall biosynthesis
MAHNRLLETLHHFTSEEAQRLFGNESALYPPDPTLELAPVKRVALIAEAFLPKVDGVSKTAYLTLNYLQQTGREVIVFAPDIAPHSVGETKVIPLPSLGTPLAPETRIGLPMPIVAQELNDFQPDLIHMFSPALLSVSGMITGRQNRIPVIANYQTDLPRYAEAYGFPILSQVVRDWLRFVHNGCHLTLAPSNWTMRELQQAGYHRMRRWGRGVNSRHFTPTRRSRQWRERLLNGRDPDSLLCIYVGRLAPEKRVDLLLEVARTPGVALTIIGDGAMRAELETTFAGTGTHFTGYLFGDDLANAYAAADAFFFTGAAETFGQVVQEGLASGLPAVIIDKGGIIDLVQAGVNGYICPDDPHEFATAARLLRDDVERRRRMSAAARRSVERNTWEAIMAQLEGHYRKAIDVNERLNRIYPPQHNLLATILNRPPIRKINERVS